MKTIRIDIHRQMAEFEETMRYSMSLANGATHRQYALAALGQHPENERLIVSKRAAKDLAKMTLLKMLKNGQEMHGEPTVVSAPLIEISKLVKEALVAECVGDEYPVITTKLDQDDVLIVTILRKGKHGLQRTVNLQHAAVPGTYHSSGSE